MRDDMKYVVIERPRHGGHGSRIRRPRRTGEEYENLPKVEGMRMRHTDRKGLSDHLNPLYRYFDKHVGRPWNDVMSEMAQHLDRSSVQGFHVWSHVKDYVSEHVRMIDGVPHEVSPYYRNPQNRGWAPVHGLYVHPETGILCRNGRRWGYHGPRLLRDKDTWKTIKVSDTITLQWIDGQWYELTFGPAEDHVVDYVVHRNNGEPYIETIIKVRKGDVVQLRKKQLSKKEKKDYGIGVTSTVHRPYGRRRKGGERRPHFLR